MSYADLDIKETKIVHTYRPSEEDRRAGVRNCVNTAIKEALATKGGNADVLIETQEAIVEKTGLFGKKVKSVTVSGYPATYKNFRPAKTDALEEAFVKGVFGSGHHKEDKSSYMGILKKIF